MIAVALLCSAVSLGGGFWLGGYCTRASMDHIVREARADRDLSDDAWEDEHERRVETLAELDKVWTENVRLRQQNATLRERCSAPPELMPSDLESWT